MPRSAALKKILIRDVLTAKPSPNPLPEGEGKNPVATALGTDSMSRS